MTETTAQTIADDLRSAMLDLERTPRDPVTHALYGALFDAAAFSLYMDDDAHSGLALLQKVFSESLGSLIGAARAGYNAEVIHQYTDQILYIFQNSEFLRINHIADGMNAQQITELMNVLTDFPFASLGGVSANGMKGHIQGFRSLDKIMYLAIAVAKTNSLDNFEAFKSVYQFVQPENKDSIGAIFGGLMARRALPVSVEVFQNMQKLGIDPVNEERPRAGYQGINLTNNDI